MRRSTLGGAPRQLASAVVLLAPLVAAGCTLVQPGCRNRDVTASIEKDARESLELTRSMSGLADLSADTAFSLTDQVEVSRQDTTRSCTASVNISIGSQSVSVPIEYEVIAGADGEAYYRWDKVGFGQKAIGTALMSTLVDMAHAKQASGQEQEATQQPDAQSDSTTAPKTAPATTPSPQAPGTPLNIMDAWKTMVRSEIAARVQKLTEMPEGRQEMLFRVGPDGDITMAKALDPVANPELADRLVKFLDGSDPVTKPPLKKAAWFKVVFSF